jgi:hypothetical protein
MSQKSNRKAGASTFTLASALLAILAQAVTSHAQAGVNERAGDSLQPGFFVAGRPDPNATASVGPALLALADVAGTGTATAGGLWVSGDTAEGLRYLQWIVGNQPTGLLEVDSRGKVSFNLRILSKAAGGAWENAADQRGRIASFVRSDEGLLLLAQVTNASCRFRLHVGNVAPTLGGNLRLVSSLNLDNRFDGRINPRRPGGQKVKNERPPEGFDCLIAINPEVMWYSLGNRQLVPTPQLVFHELAEAHARLVLDLDYLAQSDKSGAHDVAIGREIKLRQDRPGQFVIMPVGRYRVLISRNDWLWLFATLRGQKGSGLFRMYE